MLPPVSQSRSSNLFHNLKQREFTGRLRGVTKKFQDVTDRSVISNFQVNKITKVEKKFPGRIDAVALDEKLQLIAIATLDEIALYEISNLNKPLWKENILSEPFVSLIKIIPNKKGSTVIWIEKCGLVEYGFLDINICKSRLEEDGKYITSKHAFTINHSDYVELRDRICVIGERIFIADKPSCWEVKDSKLKKLPGMSNMTDSQRLFAWEDQLICVDKTFVHIYNLAEADQTKATKAYVLGVKTLVYYSEETQKYLQLNGYSINKNGYTCKAADLVGNKLFCVVSNWEIGYFEKSNFAIVDLSSQEVDYFNPAEAIGEAHKVSQLLKRDDWFVTTLIGRVKATNLKLDSTIDLNDEEGQIDQIQSQGRILLVYNAYRISLFDITTMAKIGTIEAAGRMQTVALTPTMLCSSIKETLTLWNFLGERFLNEEEEEKKETESSLTLVPIMRH